MGGARHDGARAGEGVACGGRVSARTGRRCWCRGGKRRLRGRVRIPGWAVGGPNAHCLGSEWPRSFRGVAFVPPGAMGRHWGRTGRRLGTCGPPGGEVGGKGLPCCRGPGAVVVEEGFAGQVRRERASGRSAADHVRQAGVVRHGPRRHPVEPALRCVALQNSADRLVKQGVCRRCGVGVAKPRPGVGMDVSRPYEEELTPGQRAALLWRPSDRPARPSGSGGPATEPRIPGPPLGTYPG